VSVDGPNPNAENSKPPTPKKKDVITDYSKRDSTETPNDDFFRMVDKDKIINNILEPKKTVKYFPPKKLPNPFEDAMIQQEKFLQARRDAL
jgi:hypothetical protein